MSTPLLCILSCIMFFLVSGHVRTARRCLKCRNAGCFNFLSGVCRCVCIWGVCMGEKREIEGRKGVCECPCTFEGLFEINKLKKKKRA